MPNFLTHTSSIHTRLQGYKNSSKTARVQDTETSDMDPNSTGGLLVRPPPTPILPSYDILRMFLNEQDLRIYQNKDTDFTFHADTDTVIPIQTDKRKVWFHVLSPLLAAASPIWRSQLSVTDETAPTYQNKKILLVEGDPVALSIVFLIVHFRSASVPYGHRIDLSRVYQIALVTTRYECTHLIVPWVYRWLKTIAYESSGAYRVDVRHVHANPRCSRADDQHARDHPNCATANFLCQTFRAVHGDCPMCSSRV
ncbi:hypothetical protein F4818DRAFT_458060 [Hypoxylon cercidicola]|nr:hypothetical protein F4818DRAFT_458060 [Hypoxylon cercidicola]